MTVRLHIERLVVEGPAIAPAELRRFQAAFEAGLSERVRDGDPSWGNGDVAALPCGNLTLADGASPEAVGDRIAALLYKGLTQ